ncbi:uncharacterized protein KZ484_017155 [Pholidichthys leucotaenia]
MGNLCCCRHEIPCGSIEERSVLLKHDSKVESHTGEKTVVGTCGPGGDDDTRRMPEEKKEKKSPENGAKDPNNTQENGPLKKEDVGTADPAPLRASEENTTTAQDIEETPAELLQCTLNSLQKHHDTAELEVGAASKAQPEEESPAVTQEEFPDSIPSTAKEVHPKNPQHTETNTMPEHSSVSTTHEDDVGVDSTIAKPSGELAQDDNMPNTQPATAEQESSTSVVAQELKTEIPTSAKEDSKNSSSLACRVVRSEDSQSHDVSDSSPALEPKGVSHADEEQDSIESVTKPEATAPAGANESLTSDQATNPGCTSESSMGVTFLEKLNEDVEEEIVPKVQNKDEDVPKVKEGDGHEEDEETRSVPTEDEAQAEEAGETQEVVGEEKLQEAKPAGDLKADDATKKEENLENSEEDLYRGAEELETNEAGSLPELESNFLKVEDRCSLSPAVDILSYSEREWKGNTAKSALIKKGYKEMSQRFGSLRRVRGDNYCALRATLFQVLSHTTQLPAWLQEESDIVMLPKQMEAQEGLISEWTFPGECLKEDGTGDAVQQLKGYMELLRNKWQAAVACGSAAEQLQLCEQVFQGGEEELGLLEALKLLMLGRAVELHGRMQGGEDVPLFCWLLFARDSSDSLHSFLANHLSHVGLSAGLEQVEMFLLGYALQCTIQVYRLYKADTEEFITYYPDDHKDDWPSVCLVTEDDRHYNVPIVEAAEGHMELASS